MKPSCGSISRKWGNAYKRRITSTVPSTNQLTAYLGSAHNPPKDKQICGNAGLYNSIFSPAH